MALIGLISVTEGAQPSITVEGEASPLVFAEDASEDTQINVEEDSDGIGNISVTPIDDDFLVTVTIDDAVGLVTINEPDDYIQIEVLTGAVQVTSVSWQDILDLVALYELDLGAPDGNEYILSSQINKTRKWVKSPSLYFTIEGLSGARTIPFDSDYQVNGVTIASSDGNPTTVKVGWTLGGYEILRLKEASTTNRRSYSMVVAPPINAYTTIHVTITGNANVYITAQKYK